VLVDRGSQFPRLPFQTVNDVPLSDQRMRARFLIRLSTHDDGAQTKDAVLESLRWQADRDPTLGGRFSSRDEVALEFRERAPIERYLELTATVDA
jgi:hypothetical protein